MESYNADPTDLVAPDFIDWRDRRYFGRSTPQIVGLSIMDGSDGGAPIDPTGDVSFTFRRDNPDGTFAEIFTRVATRVGIGLFEISLTGVETDTTGNYSGRWSYTLNGTPDIYTVYMVVGESNPAYDQLSENFREVVDNVWMRFADLFDSPAGGPHLQTYYQAHWSRGRMAQLMGAGLRRLNVISQPHQTYTLNGVGGTIFPTVEWGGLLEQATYIEALKHLRRSYLEQPQFQGGNVTRLDRTDYFARWAQLVQDEEDDLKGALDTFKIAHMFLGRPQVLVSGGVYGRFGPTRIAGSVAARPRYWTRFYS